MSEAASSSRRPRSWSSTSSDSSEGTARNPRLSLSPRSSRLRSLESSHPRKRRESFTDNIVSMNAIPLIHLSGSVPPSSTTSSIMPSPRQAAAVAVLRRSRKRSHGNAVQSHGLPFDPDYDDVRDAPPHKRLMAEVMAHQLDTLTLEQIMQQQKRTSLSSDVPMTLQSGTAASATPRSSASTPTRRTLSPLSVLPLPLWRATATSNAATLQSRRGSMSPTGARASSSTLSPAARHYLPFPSQLSVPLPPPVNTPPPRTQPLEGETLPLYVELAPSSLGAAPPSPQSTSSSLSDVISPFTLESDSSDKFMEDSSRLPTHRISLHRTLERRMGSVDEMALRDMAQFVQQRRGHVRQRPRVIQRRRFKSVGDESSTPAESDAI